MKSTLLSVAASPIAISRRNPTLREQRDGRERCFWKQIHQNKKSVQAQPEAILLSPASLTIECALVLPLFFFCCVTLISFMLAVKVQINENLNLSYRARQMALAVALVDDSSLEWIDLPVTKTYRYPSLLPGVPPLRVACRGRVRVWDGSPLSADEQETEMVYVSDTGFVYHTHADCTHIQLSIFVSTTQEIGSLRNESGGKYRKCKGFPKHYSGPVYASRTGEYYYPSLDYAGLTRNVRCMPKDELDDPSIPLCSRCAARGAA